MTVDEFAETISLPKTTAKLLLSRGDVTSIKVGKRRLVPVTAVRDWVERQTAEAAAQLNALTAAEGRLDGYNVPSQRSSVRIH